MKKIIFMLSLSSILQSCTIGTLVDSEKSDRYYRRYGKICYLHLGNLIPTKINADSKSFVVLSNNIGKDKESIYFEGALQNNVDYATFRVDKNGIPKDKNNVYHGILRKKLSPVKIAGIDVESYQYLKIEDRTLPRPRWAKDKNEYYLEDNRLNTDYETTKFIGNDFLYDKTKLYAHSSKRSHIIFIQEITESPKSLTKKYIQYKNRLYFLKTFDKYKKEDEVKKIDYKSINNLKIINDRVMVINDTVVYYGEKKPSFNSATFEEVEDSEFSETPKYYKDKNFVYFDAEVIKQANPKTFVILDPLSCVAKDNKYVFYKEKILTGADPTSFREGKHNEWIDDYGNRYDITGVSLKKKEKE